MVSSHRNWTFETGNFENENQNSNPTARLQSMLTWRSSRKSLSILPVPSTTDASGSSAMETGNPVSSRMRLSRFFSSAPPPVSTMPRSLMSAESSGGVRSSATRTHSESSPRIRQALRGFRCHRS